MLHDLESPRGLQSRPGAPAELLSWIGAGWVAIDHAPNPEDRIRWFALKRS